MKIGTKIIPIAIVVLLASLLAPQLQSANAGSKSPYESGYDHGCDDAGISDVGDRYINQDEKGPSFHTNEFMRGYNNGYDDCSAVGADSSNDNDKTYCDVPNPSNPCHDRKDYSETTGLYTCMDGSHEADWRDCNGNGSGNNDDDEIEVDDVEDFEGGDSQETATGDREYDPEGDSICGNDETGDEWAC